MSGLSGTPRAVFVDPSGRRGRTVRRVMWTLGLLVGLYCALVVVALVLPVGMSRLAVPGLGPLLPGPVAPALADPGSDSAPLAPLTTPSATPSTTPTTTPAPRVSPTQAAASAVTTAPTPAAVPVPVATPTPSTAPGRSAEAPGQSADAPGNDPTAKPVPASTHAAVPTPRPTKG
ncbi:hypothetical protein ASE38_05180 [Cellulomonas sp. Root930]|nr:hypothetical protein ASE38_05180 [Cellulomonas sp. Root930]